MDIFDIFAFVVFAVLIAVAVVAIVGLGSLPGAIARKSGHPQAAAVNVAGWLGLATLGVLWPLALIWAFWNHGTPASEARPPVDPEGNAKRAEMQAPVAALEASLREFHSSQEGRS
jgi:hypothetical protein